MKQFSIDRFSHGTLIFGLIAISYFLLMFGNGIVSLTHPDEVFYVQTAKEMITHDSWMTPYIFDAPQFEKPILFFWLLRAAIQGFGLAPFVARFWPAFFGMMGVIVTYGISWMLFGNKKISFWAGVILATSFIYIALSRAVLTDMVFSIIVVMTFGAFYYGYRYPKRKTIGILLMSILVAAAVLTKGVLGICFPVVLIFSYLFLRKDLKFLKCWATLWGILLFLALAVPWHVLMVRLYGNEFIYEYVYNIHIRRILESEHPKCDTWYFYPGVMVGGVMPWTFFLFPALAMVFRRIQKKHNDQPRLLFLLLWVLSIFIFVQPAHSKLASYIFPVFPAMAIMIAYYLGQIMESSKGVSAKGFKVAGYLVAGMLFVVAGSAIFVSGKYKSFIVDMAPIYAFFLVALPCAIVIFIMNRKNNRAGVVCGVCGVTIALLVTLFSGKTSAEPWVSCQQICQVLKKVDPSNSPLLVSKFYARGVRFYMDRPVAVIDINGKGFFSPHPIPFLNDDEKVLDFLGRQRVTFCVVKEGNVHDLERIAERGQYTMTHFQEIGGKFIVKIEKK